MLAEKEEIGKRDIHNHIRGRIKYLASDSKAGGFLIGWKRTFVVYLSYNVYYGKKYLFIINVLRVITTCSVMLNYHGLIGKAYCRVYRYILNRSI